MNDVTQPRADGVPPRYATAADWATSSLILRRGEEGVAWDTGVRKYGDGEHRWSDLPSPANGGSVDLGPLEQQVTAVLALVTQTAAAVEELQASTGTPPTDTPTDEAWPDLRVWGEAAMQ